MNIVFLDDEFVIQSNARIVERESIKGYVSDRRPELLDFYLQALVGRGHRVTLIKSPSFAINFFSVPRIDIDVLVLDIQMPIESLPWTDQYTTGLLVLRRVLEFQASLGRQQLPIAVLTNLNDEKTFAKLREEHKKFYPKGLWICRKAGIPASTAMAWVCNLESWIEKGSAPSGV